MKWKIIIKLLYLVVLFAVASYKWERESQLIDSDPKIDTSSLQQAYNEA
ncbi:MAG: hypothetical protein AAFY41_02690 [Bacteroidota bacterium]